MRPTRIRDLIAVALVAAGVMWALTQAFYSSLPSIPSLAGVSLYVLAAIEAVLAFVIRSRVANHEIGSTKGQLHPIAAARAVALAKASALVGALSVGVWGGMLLYLVPQHAVLHAAVTDTPGAAVGVGGGVLLAAAALWLEHCCKTPGEPPEDAAH